MLKKTLLTSLVILGLTLTAGCASKEVHVVPVGNFDPVVIRVTGYGTHGKTDVQSNASQRNLLARRASKMDAYRNLAERVYGTRIQGDTTVQNLATRDDNIRGYVNSLVRGAKVISTRELSNGSYETHMELVLEPRFQNCIVKSKSLSLAANPNCSQYTVHGEHPSQRIPVTNLQTRTRYYLH